MKKTALSFAFVFCVVIVLLPVISGVIAKQEFVALLQQLTLRNKCCLVGDELDA